MDIIIKNLTKKIKKEPVLKNINLEFRGGKVYGLQGKNGCGKTMLMRCISGLVHPEEGEILINGEALYKDINLPRSIGALIENPSFLPHYTGLTNLKILADLQGGISEEQCRELLEKVGLSAVEKKKFGEYSLGMKQRLGIAAAIMGEPDIIILDEPINAIDEDGVEEIRQLILDLRSEDRVIIIACHDRSEMELLADEVICMKNGEVISEKGCDNADLENV